VATIRPTFRKSSLAHKTIPTAYKACPGGITAHLFSNITVEFSVFLKEWRTAHFNLVAQPVGQWRSNYSDCVISGHDFAWVSVRKRIHRIEHCISSSQKTVIDLVTKRSHYVNVHLSKFLLLFDYRNFTRSGHLPQGWRAFCLI